MQQIVRLEPFFSHAPWGGNRLAQWKNLPSSTSIAESWEVSALPNASSRMGGVELSTLLSSNDLPYLVKLIDTNAELSIQVHPCNQYLQQQQINSLAKDECWLILQAQTDAGIYLGLRPDVTPELFFTVISNREKVQDLLNFIPVAAGDFFFVPAGLAHAIGKNITLMEVQRPVNSTFRLWDWNRTGAQGRPRELHLKDGLAVLQLNWEQNCQVHQAIQKNFSTHPQHLIFSHSDFALYTMSLSQKTTHLVFRHSPSHLRWRTIMAVNGTIILNNQVTLTHFTSALVSNNIEEITITTMDQECRILWVE